MTKRAVDVSTVCLICHSAEFMIYRTACLYCTRCKWKADCNGF